MADQLRKEREVIGHNEDDSVLKMNKETEQRIIREFRSPFPEESQEQRENALLSNAQWR
jgi:hypothetical protein